MIIGLQCTTCEEAAWYLSMLYIVLPFSFAVVFSECVYEIATQNTLIRDVFIDFANTPGVFPFLNMEWSTLIMFYMGQTSVYWLLSMMSFQAGFRWVWCSRTRARNIYSTKWCIQLRGSHARTSYWQEILWQVGKINARFPYFKKISCICPPKMHFRMSFNWCNPLWYCSTRPRGEQFLVRWAITQLHDIDALSKMVDPSLDGSYPSKSLSRFADIISLCVQVSL